MDSEQARDLLVNEEQRLAALIAEREAEGLTTESESGGISELSSSGQHPGDLGTETFEREKDFAILEQLSADIEDLERALRKVDDGTYGVCEVCGRPIPDERLEAMPATRFCIEHAASR